MTDRDEPASAASLGGGPVGGGPRPSDELAAVSPVRSMAAISLSFLIFTQVLTRLALVTVNVLAPDAFPAQSDDGPLAVPATSGLVLLLVCTSANAVLAGLLAGRIGRAMRKWHGVVLGGILGMFAAVSMDQLQGFPGWFALGWLLAPSLGAALGGILSERVAPARAPAALVGEAVPLRRAEPARGEPSGSERPSDSDDS